MKDDTQRNRYSDRIGDFDRLCLSLKARQARKKQQVGKQTMGHKWIDRYFESVSLRFGLRKKLEYPRPQIKGKEESIDLTATFRMLSQEASCVACCWTNVNTKYDDRRSFRGFLLQLEISGLDTYPFIKDNGNLPNRRLPGLQHAHLNIIPSEYHNGTLSVIQFMRRIALESDDEFRRGQALLLESFLDHLIKIQEEQRFVEYSFYVRLDQLGQFDLVSFSSNAVDDDDGFVWTQKHILDNIYIMSRESAWLLEGLSNSGFTSPPSIKESKEMLGIILDFVSESKLALDQNHLDDIIHDFGRRIKSLQEQGVERKSAVEVLLGCFVDVVDMLYEPLMPSRGTHSSLGAFSKAANDTLKLIVETEKKLSSVWCSDLTSGGSPLGCMVLWRILFESSLFDLRLDRIYKKLSETVELRVVDAELVVSDRLDLIRVQLNHLLEAGSRVRDQLLAMQIKVAEVTFTLGDAFATGGALVRSLTYSPGTFYVDRHAHFDANDFPWDKHTVRVSDGKDPIPCNVDG